VVRLRSHFLSVAVSERCVCSKEASVPVPIIRTLPETDKWIERVDIAAFKHDVRELGKRLEEQMGEEDTKHLNKIISWSNMLAFVGFATAWLAVNPISFVCLSLFTTSRWVMIAHHTCHGGYDTCPPAARFNRFKFAVGSLWRRLCDWYALLPPCSCAQ
jgi:hypothetical protein